MMSSDSKVKDKNEVGQVWNFKGKYADYMRDLYSKDHEEYKVIFDQIYHGYAFCALYGLLKGRKHKYDPSIDNPNDSTVLGFRWAYADTSGIFAYENIRKYVLLYSKSICTDFDKKIDRALRFDYTTNDVINEELISKSQYKENSDIIDEYVLGGLELIHEKINECEDYQSVIFVMKQIIKEMQENISNKSKTENK